MNTKVICLAILLIAGYAQAQLSSMANQFNPIADNSVKPNVGNDESNISPENMDSNNSKNDENLSQSNGTNEQNRPDNNQQQNGFQQSNIGGNAGNAAKETIQENHDSLKNSMNSMMNVGKAHVNAAKNLAETGIKFGTTFPRFGSKVMGQMSNNDGQKNGPFGGFGF